MISERLPLFFGCLALSACSQQTVDVPTEIAGIEKAFGVEICKGSKARLVDNLAMVSASPVYEISFPNARCLDAFLQSLTENSVYEHPFGDKNKLLGSNENGNIQFSTMKQSDQVVIFHVTDIS